MYSQVKIEYANPQQLDDTYIVTFNLRSHSVVERWVKKVQLAQTKWSIDDPNRFYSFSPFDQQVATALAKINHTIDVINAFEPIVDRHLTDIHDQDTLNYLHHIFEVHHGLLDSQTSEFWQRSTPVEHRALADLNIQVHECEVVGRYNVDVSKPFHIVSWYKMPKFDVLADDEYTLFEDQSRAGTVYLLYTEIGKTFEDLAIDNDQYIHDEAFRPFRHYSADFFVNYYTEDTRLIEEKRVKIKQYYDRNKEFFVARGLDWGHPYLATGRLPLADIDNFSQDVVVQLATRQQIKSIKFI